MKQTWVTAGLCAFTVSLTAVFTALIPAPAPVAAGPVRTVLLAPPASHPALAAVAWAAERSGLGANVTPDSVWPGRRDSVRAAPAGDLWVAERVWPDPFACAIPASRPPAQLTFVLVNTGGAPAPVGNPIVAQMPGAPCCAFCHFGRAWGIAARQRALPPAGCGLTALDQQPPCGP